MDALVAACVAGDLPTVERLLSTGADIHVGDDLPLRSAAAFGYVHCCRVLLAAGADPEARGGDALACAERGGHTCTVALLRASQKTSTPPKMDASLLDVLRPLAPQLEDAQWASAVTDRAAPSSGDSDAGSFHERERTSELPPPPGPARPSRHTKVRAVDTEPERWEVVSKALAAAEEHGVALSAASLLRLL